MGPVFYFSDMSPPYLLEINTQTSIGYNIHTNRLHQGMDRLIGPLPPFSCLFHSSLQCALGTRTSEGV